jgi:hypothetical protein
LDLFDNIMNRIECDPAIYKIALSTLSDTQVTCSKLYYIFHIVMCNLLTISLLTINESVALEYVWQEHIQKTKEKLEVVLEYVKELDIPVDQIPTFANCSKFLLL